jgi:hypothetical protein
MNVHINFVRAYLFVTPRHSSLSQHQPQTCTPIADTLTASCELLAATTTNEQTQQGNKTNSKEAQQPNAQNQTQDGKQPVAL